MSKEHIMHNTQTRDAKRIIHELHSILCHMQAQELPFVAKGLAGRFNLPKKTMLKAMARYTRIHHTH
jgi:hypothetical protein